MARRNGWANKAWRLIFRMYLRMYSIYDSTIWARPGIRLMILKHVGMRGPWSNHVLEVFMLGLLF